nr:hypothetical protein B0A51_07874 [Rachicladosporium sp. CCFEE 5018]
MKTQHEHITLITADNRLAGRCDDIMDAIRKFAVIGASGNLGQPITAALLKAGFDVTIITRVDSTTAHPPDVAVVRTQYDLPNLTRAFTSQDAVVCVVGLAGVAMQNTFIDAAEAAGVRRFIINDFGWEPEMRNLPALDAIFAERLDCRDYAQAKAAASRTFTWTGIASGSPIDRVLRLFPAMGFDVASRKAIIYDDGTGMFTGTTLDGIGAAVIGVLRHPEQTANRFVTVMSIKTCQTELLEAFEQAVDGDWKVQRSSASAIIAAGREKLAAGDGSGLRDIALAHIFDPGEGRCVVAPSWEESDSGLLGVEEVSVEDLVAAVVKRASIP